jgi:hypothetical protein
MTSLSDGGEEEVLSTEGKLQQQMETNMVKTLRSSLVFTHRAYIAGIRCVALHGEDDRD